jgi:hypothetical protein
MANADAALAVGWMRPPPSEVKLQDAANRCYG